MRVRALRAGSEAAPWRVLNGEARRMMRAYTTSFFIDSRFLPRAKREEVEAVYAAVRYPDEVVDTFALGTEERLRRLEEWRGHYEMGINSASLREALLRGVPAHLAGFTRVVRRREIPARHYRDFLGAMRRALPRTNPVGHQESGLTGFHSPPTCRVLGGGTWRRPCRSRPGTTSRRPCNRGNRSNPASGAKRRPF